MQQLCQFKRARKPCVKGLKRARKSCVKGLKRARESCIKGLQFTKPRVHVIEENIIVRTQGCKIRLDAFDKETPNVSRSWLQRCQQKAYCALSGGAQAL